MGQLHRLVEEQNRGAAPSEPRTNLPGQVRQPGQEADQNFTARKRGEKDHEKSKTLKKKCTP